MCDSRNECPMISPHMVVSRVVLISGRIPSWTGGSFQTARSAAWGINVGSRGFSGKLKVRKVQDIANDLSTVHEPAKGTFAALETFIREPEAWVVILDHSILCVRE